MTLTEIQDQIRATFGEKDHRRGPDGTFMWFMEEVGELAGALRGGSKPELVGEFADVLAWLVSLANIAQVDLDEAFRSKFGSGCSVCGQQPCSCPPAEKP